MGAGRGRVASPVLELRVWRVGTSSIKRLVECRSGGDIRLALALRVWRNGVGSVKGGKYGIFERGALASFEEEACAFIVEEVRVGVSRFSRDVGAKKSDSATTSGAGPSDNRDNVARRSWSSMDSGRRRVDESIGRM